MKNMDSRSQADFAITAVAAEVLMSLRSRDISPCSGRVVIECADLAPQLAPLLLDRGVGCVTSWNSSDAQEFSSRRVLQHNDVLVDLSESTPPYSVKACDHALASDQLNKS